VTIIAERGLFVRLLVQSGKFETASAEALVDALDASTRESATKADLVEARNELQTYIAAFRSEIKADIAALRSETKSDIAALRTEPAPASPEQQLAEALRGADLDALTPREALDLLYELKRNLPMRKG